jgi:hypothetical protein
MVYALLFASPVANRDFYVCDDDMMLSVEAKGTSCGYL